MQLLVIRYAWYAMFFRKAIHYCVEDSRENVWFVSFGLGVLLPFFPLSLGSSAAFHRSRC